MGLSFLITWDQHIRGWAASLGTPVEDLLRLAIALVLGGLVGLEREMRGRQAGFRTYILVCVGSALVMIVSTQMALEPWQPANDHYTIRVDPGRIAYGVMMGIGFLGGGVIVQSHRGKVHGLTTAAGLWCMAAVGLAAGLGMYVVTVLATLLVLLTLFVLHYFEELLPKSHYRTVTVRMKWQAGCISAIVDKFRSAGLKVVDASFDRTPDLQSADVHIHFAFTQLEQYYIFERQLEADDAYQLISAKEI